MTRKTVNWEAVEADYRAGILSLREIGEAHGISHVMVSKKAKAQEWPRDLKTKIQAKAADLVNKASIPVNAPQITEREIVNRIAEGSATIQLTQRTDIQRARSLCMSLLAELEAQTANIPGLENLGEILRNPGENGQDKLNDVYRAVISLPERTKTMKAWTESFRALITMEREAYGIQVTEPSKEMTVRLLPSDAGLL